MQPEEDAGMDEGEKQDLLDTAVRAFHELRQRMSEEAAVCILVNTIVLSEENPPWPLTPEQIHRVRDVLDDMRLLDERSLRH